MLNVIIGFVGLIIGGIFFQIEGAVVGLFIGVLFSEINSLKSRIKMLEMSSEFSEETTETPQRYKEVQKTQAPQDSLDEYIKEESATVSEYEAEAVEFQLAPDEEASLPVGKQVDNKGIQDKHPAKPAKENLLEQGIRYVFHFFTTGNVVAKIGIIVLFFGVAFLLKFVAQRNLFPLEARLVCVAIGAIAMIAFGWRVRGSRLAYGLILQGGGVGILYLDLFAAARYFDLMPVVLAFGVMVFLVVLSVLLAVLQNSQTLAGFGIIGGFLAPVLMSIANVSHVAWFSYYALLNAGIFGVAWFRAWRILNLIGFAFTFVIGALWGAEYYRPHYFNSVEPFLVLSFVFYVAISVLFAFRQPFHLRGYVDTTLVFGTPIVVFALQQGLVRNYEYGLAISAVAMSASYILLATVLWKKNVEGMRLLTESFLALGVLFGSLAIPLALDGQWTTASWSLEGVALVWVGIRQQRILARNFGLLLIVGANIALFTTNNEPISFTPIINGFYLSCFVISMSSLISSYLLYASKKVLESWERQFHYILLAVGLAWWYFLGFFELERQLPGLDLYNNILLFVSLSCVIKFFVANRLDWRVMKMPCIGLLPVMVLTLLISSIDIHGYHPFFRFGMPVWGIALFVHFFLLAGYEEAWPQRIVSWWHTVSLWLLTLLVTLEATWWLDHLVKGTQTWEYACFGIIPAATIFMLMSWGERLRWPVKSFKSEYFGTGLGVLILYVILWELFSCLKSGNPVPLTYIPVLNPLDLSQLFALFVIGSWAWKSYKGKLPVAFSLHYKLLMYTPAILFFIVFNAIIARTIHHFVDIPYTSFALFNSIVFHAVISISWALIALFITFWATRKGVREVWFAGAVLLSCIVLKLFLVDLASSGTVARIVSFLVVGILMLVIGYLSPLPAAVKNEKKG